MRLPIPPPRHWRCGWELHPRITVLQTVPLATWVPHQKRELTRMFANLYSRLFALMERASGIEPPALAWQASVLTTIRRPQKFLLGNFYPDPPLGVRDIRRPLALLGLEVIPHYRPSVLPSLYPVGVSGREPQKGGILRRGILNHRRRARNGADERIRTSTRQLPLAPQASASTNSATSAYLVVNPKLFVRWNLFWDGLYCWFLLHNRDSLPGGEDG